MNANSGLETDSGQKPTFGKRLEGPEGDKGRQKFEEVLLLAYRYGKNISEMTAVEIRQFLGGKEFFKIDEDDNEVLDDEGNKIRTHNLVGEIEQLRNSDPFITLLERLQASESDQERFIDVENHDIRVGCYKLSNPSLKDLNDKYLGETNTNAFIAELHNALKNHLKGNADILQTFFKGGYFLMDFGDRSHIPADEKERDDIIDNLRIKLWEFQDIANEILKKHIGKKITEYTGDKKNEKEGVIAKSKAWKDYLKAQSLKDESEWDDAVKEVVEGAGSIDNAILNANRTYELSGIAVEYLKSLDSSLNGEKGAKPTKIEVSFGSDKLETRDPKESSACIRNAEVAANMSKKRYEVDRNRKKDAKNDNDELPEELRKRGFFQEYKDEYLKRDIIRGYQDLEESILDENGDIKSEYEDVFYPRDGRIYMRGKMIIAHRKKDYSHLSGLSAEDLEEVKKVFGRYYDTVNLVDSLKNFRLQKFDHYIKRIQSIIGVLRDAETAVDDKKTPINTLRKCLAATSRELELSVKDEGRGVLKTTRSEIKFLMQEGEKLMLALDHIGFAKLNMLGLQIYIEDLLEVYEKIGTDNKAELADNSLEGGDAGSEHLRNIDEVLSRIFSIVKSRPKDANLNVSGGDEIGITLRGEHLKLDIETKLKLIAIAASCWVRMKATLTGYTLNGVDDISREITNETRANIVELLGVINGNEEAHKRIKKRLSEYEERFSNSKSYEALYKSDINNLLPLVFRVVQSNIHGFFNSTCGANINCINNKASREIIEPSVHVEFSGKNTTDNVKTQDIH